MAAKHIVVSVVVALAVGTIATVAARTSSSTTPTTSSTFRSCAAVLESEVCAWVEMEGETAVELGATVPMALIEGVPSEAEMVWPPAQLVMIPLPAEARSALGIDHVGINWEPHGHPPAPFLKPHFDFHFYSIAPEEVAAIDCSDESKPATLPAGYVLPDMEIPDLGLLVGACVPGMGMHAVAQEKLESTDLFDAAMMMGYYGGVPIFFEPMVAQDRLLERTDFAIPVPAIEGLPDGVRYPREFRGAYDASAEAYRLVFADFESR